MNQAGSFTAQHYGGTDLAGAVARARQKLGADVDRPHFTEMQRLAWHLLRDASRLAAAVPHILNAQPQDEEVTAESIEVIARKVLEHAIFLEYLQNNRHDEELVARFLANCRAAFAKSHKQTALVSDKPPDWPNYEQMAKSYPALYDLYRRLSYLAHPKTCMPYTFLELGSGMSKRDFFLARAQLACTDLATILHIATDTTWILGIDTPAPAA